MRPNVGADNSDILHKISFRTNVISYWGGSQLLSLNNGYYRNLSLSIVNLSNANAGSRLKVGTELPMRQGPSSPVATIGCVDFLIGT